MSQSINEDSSDFVIEGGSKQTKLQIFLHSLTTDLIKDMKQYVILHQLQFQRLQYVPHKISLYEDLLAIIKVKQNEDAGPEKIKMRSILQKISSKTKRKLITIDERLRKKLSQLTPYQIRYHLQRKLDFQFTTDRRLRTANQIKNIQAIFQPQVQKQISHKKQFRQRLQRMRQEKQKQKQQQQNYTYIQIQSNEASKSKNNQQKIDNYINSASHQSFEQNQYSQQKEVKIPQIMSNEQKLSEKMVNKWKQNNLQRYQQIKEKNIKQTQILYNHSKRAYIYLNQEIVKSVLYSIKQQQILQKIRAKQLIKSQQEKLNQQNQIKKQLKKYNSGFQGEKQKTFNETKLASSKNDDLNSSARKIRVPSSKKMIVPQIIEIDDSQQNQLQLYLNQNKPFNESIIQQSKQQDRFKNKRGNQIEVEEQVDPIQKIQELANNLNKNQLPQCIRRLLQKGLQIKDQILHQRKVNGQSQSQSIRKEGRENQEQYFMGKYNTIDLVSDEEQQNSNQNQNSSLFKRQQAGQQQSAKKMIYWFNNDSQTYETYLDDPYKRGNLMWCEEEDNILSKANNKFQLYFDQLQDLIKDKSAEVVQKRVQFLNIHLNFQFQQYLQSFNQ